MQWKSLEAYNYLVMLDKYSSNCILMAPAKAHHAWVGLACYCTCMAGSIIIAISIIILVTMPWYVSRLGGGCSHSAGILFKVKCAVQNGYSFHYI